MKSALRVLLLALPVVCVDSALANAQLAQKKNCMSCHTVARKVIGPGFKDVAVKYAGQPDAVDKLAQKVLTGGSGVWGPVFMPGMKDANPPVSPAEAKELVQWILSLK